MKWIWSFGDRNTPPVALMKKSCGFGIIFFMIFIFRIPAAGTEKIINVPVRVFADNKPVHHLTAKDFTIYENTEHRTLKGFDTRKKRLRPPGESPGVSRYFVLMFQMSGYNNRVRAGMTYFFDSIAGKGDRLLVTANDHMLFFDNLIHKEKARSQIENMLVNQCNRNRKQMIAELKEMKTFMDKIRTRSAREMDRDGVGAVHLHYYMKYLRFSFDQYLKTLREYKRKYIIPDINSFYKVSKRMEEENIDGEKTGKWLFFFYQGGRVPELSTRNREWIKKLIRDLQDNQWRDELYYSDIFKRMLATIGNTFDEMTDFPTGDVTKLFYNVDTTFNSVMLQGSSAVFYENSLREIAQKTGGVCILPGNNIASALDTFAAKEDISYMLTFTPGEPGKTGKIKVEVNDERYRVYYSDKIGTDFFTRYLKKEENEGIPSVRINDAALKNKIFTVSITHFLREKTQNGMIGKLSVRIRIKDQRNNKDLFDQSKTMLTGDDTVRISIPFTWLKKGRYSFLIEVQDLVTGKTGFHSLQAVVD